MDTITGTVVQDNPVQSSGLDVNFTLTERFLFCFCRDCQTVVSSCCLAVLDYLSCVYGCACVFTICVLCVQMLTH